MKWITASETVARPQQTENYFTNYSTEESALPLTISSPGPDARETMAQIPRPMIADLAYGLWQNRGCPDGSPAEDWFQAEAALRARLTSPLPGLSEMLPEVTDIPGFAEPILESPDLNSPRNPLSEVEELLRGRLNEATARHRRARGEYARVSRLLTGKSVDEDEGKRLESANRALEYARQALLRALTEFNLFLTDGAIPDDLKKLGHFASPAPLFLRFQHH